MAFQFSSPPPYVDGALFLGVDEYAAGITTPRHLITIAGARSGKGVGLIIPNLLEWEKGSVLVIDPKGENAAATWQRRENMGQKVRIIDPFEVADVPDRLRVAFNPLQAVLHRESARSAGVGAKPSTAREDIRVIADGLVMRTKAEDAMWDNGAVTVLAGMIAHTLSTAPAELRTLPAMRSVLRWTDDDLEAVFQDMAENPAFGGLAQAAAAVGLSSAKSAREFIKGARDQSEWLDSAPMGAVLDHSDFDLADLKNGKTSVYLVLPPEYLQEHGRFLRLFVRCAINAMAKGGQGGGKCLFLLDEFFSLGHIEEIAKAAGLMPSYGVHLWPFLQDLGQLVKLYGKEGAETFFGNADAHIFFGNTDPLTLEHVSARFGRYSADEITVSRAFPIYTPPPLPPADKDHQVDRWLLEMGRAERRREDELEAYIQNERYEAQARKVGQPRMPAEAIRELVGKKTGDVVARSMIVFGQGGDIFSLKIWPYFRDDTPPLYADFLAAQKRLKEQGTRDQAAKDRAAEMAKLSAVSVQCNDAAHTKTLSFFGFGGGLGSLAAGVQLYSQGHTVIGSGLCLFGAALAIGSVEAYYKAWKLIKELTA